MNRASLVTVIRVYGEELQRVARERPGAPIERDRLVMQALQKACEEGGLTLQEVLAAMKQDRSLWELAAAVTREALVATPDPGPYDVISREASSGTPENEHVGAIGTLEVGLPWEDRWW